MQRLSIVLLILITGVLDSYAQTVTGQFTSLKTTPVTLEGFKGFDTFVIATATTDNLGNFTLKYPTTYNGMGFVRATDTAPTYLVLNGENITIKNTAPEIEGQTTEILAGDHNKMYQVYNTEQPVREQVLGAWVFLEQSYQKVPVLKRQTVPLTDINKEINRLQQEEQLFLDKLPDNSYLKWFLPIRKLVANAQVVAQYRTAQIPQTRDAFKAIDYSSPRLYNSGLLNETLEQHVWFIENTSGELDQVFTDLNSAIDGIIKQLSGDDVKFNAISEKLFNILEKRSLYTSAEYLAKKLLTDDSCGCLNNDLKKQFEKYGKMAEGATAADIVFTANTYYPEGVTAKKLSEVQAAYKLVVFAASWCPHCVESMPELVAYYPTLKQKNVEVIFVSLDTNPADFAKFAAHLPFLSTTDYKKWDGTAATDYQVYGTPSYFMLDANQKILKKLASVEHLKSWVDSKIN